MTRLGNAETGFFIFTVMEIIFDDNDLHVALAPLALTRPIAEIRFGILTFKESWMAALAHFYPTIEVAYATETYIHAKFPSGDEFEALTIMGNIKPMPELVEAISQLKRGEVLYANDRLVARFGLDSNQRVDIHLDNLLFVENCWDLFQKNDRAIELDFELLTMNRVGEKLNATNRCLNEGNIFVEKGAKVNFAILNANDGPIYIGKDAEIMEGSMIRGPFSIGEHGVVKMGAKIYGATSIGPHCKVGGELSNCIFQAYSNKGHDGFLGNSVVGEWCNFGADTNSSNLKNNYSPVKIHSFKTNQLEQTNVQFCGVLMGDHGKTGINTMLNTATVIGVSANIFGGGFPSKFIPSFTWGGVNNQDRFILDKAFEVAENMMSRRSISLTDGDKSILSYLYANLA